MLALSRDRLWLTATLMITLVAAVPAVLAVQARSALENSLNSQAAADQGHQVLPILALAIAGALLCFAAVRWLEHREGKLTVAALRLSRNQALLAGIGVFAISFAAVVALTLGPRAWDRFSQTDLKLPNQPSKHFTDLTGSGRREFWRVAYHDFTDRPLLGQGAGTYGITWEQRRTIDLPVHDAHSLYLEAFAELGAVGGLLMLGLVGSAIAIGLMAWRRSSGPERERAAVLWAVALAFAISAAFDWFWELPGLGAVFFLATGALLSTRSGQLAAEDEAIGIPDSGRRYWLLALGLALAWLSAAALVAPLLVDREITASQNAAAAGDLGTARNHAESARSIEPWAASPYVQLGLLDELRGDYAAAAVRFSDAIDREDRNWQLYFLRARVQRRLANRAAARADIAKARELNPLAPELAGERGLKQEAKTGRAQLARSGDRISPLAGGRYARAASRAGPDERRLHHRDPPAQGPGARGPPAAGGGARPGAGAPGGSWGKAARLGAAPALGDGRLGGTARGALRGHRGDRDDRRGDALLGALGQPDLDPRLQAARPL